MTKKKRSSTRRTASSVKVKSKRTAKKSEGVSSRLILPLAISGVMLVALALVVAFGYRTATASEFFKLKNVDVRGNDRTSAEDIRRTVLGSAGQTGVWNADLGDIRTKIEKFPFVKSAAVCMQLPAGIRVNIVERVPTAIVQLSSGAFLVDVDGTILAAATDQDKRQFPFALTGWDES
ncbi:MAG: FtsQ-type POTRA domain-containing protein, partial [Acidobacteria bacterium]|nr:FtsQ-type POTRA domain-containing protein [Acidobacteriota bacterium]